MENLKYYLKKAKEGGYAIPHFNFASAEQLRALVEGFNVVYGETGEEVALMVGTSEGEANFLGYGQSRALVDVWKKETGLPIFLNADHHKSFASTQKAIDAGYDSVLIDLSKISIEENISVTKNVVKYMRDKNIDGVVEGELGYMRGSSEIQESIEISEDDFTKPIDAEKFVDETRVNSLAVAIGNIHGITTKQKMELDINLLERIVDRVDAFVVLHGGSGLSNEDFKKAIDVGVSNIHINTEIRIAYRRGIEEIFESDKKVVTPYKYLDNAVKKMRNVVVERSRLFLGI